MNFAPGRFIQHPKTKELYLILVDKGKNIKVQDTANRIYLIPKSEFEEKVMDWKVGDKYKINKMDLIHIPTLLNGQQVTTDTILTVNKIDSNNIVTYVDNGRINISMNAITKFEEWKVGDKFTIRQEKINDYITGFWLDTNGKVITVDTIHEVSHIDHFNVNYIGIKMTWMNSMKIVGTIIDENHVIKVEDRKARLGTSKLECTCPSFSLANHGCKCGFVDEMKKLGKEW